MDIQGELLEHRVILEDAYRKDSGSLSEEQIQTYDDVGFVVLENLLDEQDLTKVKESMMARVDEIAEDLFSKGLIKDKYVDSTFEYRLAELFQGLTDEDFLKYGRSWRDRLPGYFDLMTNSKVLDAIESLIGPEIFSNPVYNTRPKVPGVTAGAVPWHQDKSYWPDAEAIPVLTCWIALVDATEEKGCLNIWPGTHRMTVLSYHHENHTGTGYTETDEKHLINVKIESVPVTAGSAIIFNDRILHMSGPNKTQNVRWSVDLRYQPTDQDPMPNHGAGFLARSADRPEAVAYIEDWLSGKPEHNSQ